MGFETQEEADRWAENIEFRADQLREERLLAKSKAWVELTQLPAFKDMPKSVMELQSSVFDYAWEAAMITVKRFGR